MFSNLFQKEPITPTKQMEGIDPRNEAYPLSRAFKINNLERYLLVAQNNLKQQKQFMSVQTCYLGQCFGGN